MPARSIAAAALVLAACQPQEQRLLVLDQTHADPIVLNALAGPWAAAGYRVEYRRFYPHLTRADLGRYRTLVLLGGGAPERPSDPLNTGDFALLGEWTARGGVVVVGYEGAGAGAADRWVLNRWLTATGTGIAIGGDPLQDSVPAAALAPQPRVTPLGGSGPREAAFEAFPGGRNHALRVPAPAAALARANRRSPVIAATRVDAGLVMVTSRQLLNVLGPDQRPSTMPWLDGDGLARARTFLVALARWTRRPAEWASLPAGVRHRRWTVLDAPRAVPVKAAPLTPPPGADARPLPEAAARGDTAAVALPDWLRHGVRLVWVRQPLTGADAAPAPRGAQLLDSVVAFLQVGNLTALVSAAYPQAAPDSVVVPAWQRDAVRALWRAMTDRLETTSQYWIPALDFRDFPPATDSLPGPACPLAPEFWARELLPAARTLAHLAVEQRDLIPALAFDLENAPPADPFCPAVARAGIAGLVRTGALDSARSMGFAGLSPATLADSLEETGLLASYDSVLEAAVADRVRALRTVARRGRPDLLFVVRGDVAPADWFRLGVLRGLAVADAPVILLTPEPDGRALAARYAARGIPVLTAVALVPRRIAPADWPRLRRLAFERNDGFWLPTAVDGLTGVVRGDSLARLVRRLVK
ncbi:MAG TPA: hypothetical protein VF923_06180 [Gemmatimonadales bacterium]